MAAVTAGPILILLARLAAAGVFVIAALPKIQNPGEFADAVAAYRVIGPELSRWVALVLPWLELVLGIGLLLPWLRRASAVGLALLLLLFIGLHAAAWARGLDLACGCFGADADANTGAYLFWILRNLALFAATLCVALRDFRLHRRAFPPEH